MNDGSEPIPNGARYFQCAANKGIFVRGKRIKSKLGNPEHSEQVESSPKMDLKSTEVTQPVKRRPRSHSSQSNRMRGRNSSRKNSKNA